MIKMHSYFQKINLLLLLLVVLAGLGFQTKKKALKSYIDVTATVKMYVCSRGCYQYLIEIEKEQQLFFCENLSTEFQADGTKIVIDGYFYGDSTDVMQPGPTDIPVFRFRAPNIELGNIRAKQ